MHAVYNPTVRPKLEYTAWNPLKLLEVKQRRYRLPIELADVGETLDWLQSPVTNFFFLTIPFDNPLK